ncbi:MAG: hypothetical protein LEGION0403_FIIPPAGN_00483 [Legionella sp.]|uniref:hypothetical protein n=1 Tax=Legionella sp. TaxID=459 RepID=UPI003D12A74C
MGFFDSLASFQDFAGYSIASSKKIHELGGLVSVYLASNLYYQEEIKSYFNDLTNLIDVLDIPTDDTAMLVSIAAQNTSDPTLKEQTEFVDKRIFPSQLN